MSDKKAPEPMDVTAPERPVGEPSANHERACFGIVTLVGEVLHLFPETAYEVSNYNGRNVGLTVSFPQPENELGDLLRLTVVDTRVSRVHIHNTHNGGGDAVDVVFQNRPRTYDLRDSFGLDEAWSVLAEETWEGGDATDTSPDVQDGGGA